MPTHRKTWAQCYGGHQFGYWAGQLGDGRAISLGQVTCPDGKLLELQLKVRMLSMLQSHILQIPHTALGFLYLLGGTAQLQGDLSQSPPPSDCMTFKHCGTAAVRLSIE